MPAQLQFFDMEVLASPGGPYVPVPIAVGPNWQPGDVRIVFQCVFGPGTTARLVLVPPGYTELAYNNPQECSIAYRRLQPGDTNTFIQYTSAASGYQIWTAAIITVRGVHPSSSPTAAFDTSSPPSVTIPTFSSTGGTSAYPSFSIPGAGAAVLWYFSGVGVTVTQPTGASLGTPAGWTNLVATDDSGAAYTPYSGKASTALAAKSFSSSGSSGAADIPYGAENGSALSAGRVFIPAASDVSGSAGACSEADTAANATFSSTTTSANTAGNASETDTSTTAFNALQGYWVSDPLTLPGDPVTGSAVRWAGNTPTGSTAIVETSINNGASWDTATVNRPVPRLKAGDTYTRSVLARISFTRTLSTDPAPTMAYLELAVSTDSGTVEYVPIGHGMIDKTTVKAVGGSSGGGSSSGSVGSSAVISKGGGQTGGGTSIKIHVTDMSRAIKRNVWQMPFVVPKGTNYGDAVKAMVLDRLPSQTEFAISTTTRVLSTALVYGMDQGGDPWQDIREVAQAIGYECFFDPRGVFVFRPVPDPRIGEPVFTFDENFNPIVAEASKAT